MIIESSSIGRAAGSLRSDGKTQRFLLWCCIAVLAIAPLLLGSARPTAWLLWAMVIAAIGCLYALSVLIGAQQVAVPLAQFRVYFLLSSVVCAMLVIQLLPIGQVVGPLKFSTASGQQIEGQFLSLAPSATLLMLIRMVSFGLFFFLVAQITVRRKSAMLLQRTLLLIVTGYGLVGLAALSQGDTLLGMSKWAYLGSAVGPFVNRNSFATFLSFALVLGTAQLLAELQPFIGLKTRVLLRAVLRSWIPVTLAAVVIILAALLATQSRMGLFAGTVGVVCVLVATAIRWRANLGILSLIVVAGLIGGGVLFFAYGSGLLERVGSLETSADDRLAFYREVWAMITARPITGYGGGSFELAFPLFHRPPVTADMVWDRAHSSYHALWSELGLIVGSLPIVFYGLIAISAARLLFKSAGSALVGISALGCLAVAA
ncbi:MAG TPA: O-antigen ligase family protein, partial [Devosia sp.]|nr:O-antigen ligase family protein [Devosia sp.]